MSSNVVLDVVLVDASKTEIFLRGFSTFFRCVGDETSLDSDAE